MIRFKNKNHLLLLVALGLPFCGCSKNSHEGERVFQGVEVAEVPQDMQLPTVLWDLLEEKKYIKSNGKIASNSETSSHFEENVFVGLTVRLIEKTPGILGGQNFEIKTQKSGLTLDLANYIKLSRGTFLFSFEPTYTLDPVTAQVFFLSHSPKRVIDGQKVGGGCNEFYDITKSYFKLFQQPGIEVNVTNGRHIGLLGGTFFLRVSHQGGVRALTQLTVIDSSGPEWMCQRGGVHEEE